MSRSTDSVFNGWRPLLLAGALLAGGLAGCEMLPQQAAPVPTLVFVPPATPTLSPDAVYTVARGPIQEVVKARGRVASALEAPLAFRTSGFVKDIQIKPGDQAQPGDLLAELDSPAAKTASLQDAIVDVDFDLQLKSLELEQAKAEPIDQTILSTKSTLKLAQVSVQQAQAAYDQIAWKGDTAASGTEAFALQKAQLTVEAAQANYNAALARKDPQGLKLKYLETQIAYARARIDRARRRLAETDAEARLTAPFTGTIVSVDKKIGDAVGPYEPLGIIADPSQIRLEVNILEADMVRVRLGLPVSITLDAYPNEPLTGRIQAIAAQPTTWQGKSAYAAAIEFDDATRVPATIRMGADVAIVTRVVPDALLAPAEAIKTDGARRYVDLFQDGAAPRRVDVGLGLTAGPLTEVLWGLTDGDRIRIR